MPDSLNEPGELKARLKFLGPNTDQWELQDILDAANRKLSGFVGRDIQEKLRPTVEDQERFRLAFSEVQNIRKVEIREHRYNKPERVDSSNYTVTGNPAKISFDSSWVEQKLSGNDYSLRVFYQPTLYKELELMLALEEVMNLSSVQTGDDETRAMFEQYQDRRQELVRQINRTAQNIDDRDAGDTLASNFNFPGDRI
jgi:hypothetical protein